MSRNPHPRLLFRLVPALLPALLLLAPGVSAQTGGVSREEMWWAPTAEDWKKPCLIAWQRTWEDALEVMKETGKPILVCINMDGEIASEHYAGIRYRQPEIAALYEPYVCVIASTYRHTPRDYDEEGARILCPRFGGVTCGEHIAIEPGLFEKYMEGQRVAPRHIAVELDAQETYDVFYAFDTDSVFQQIREGIENREVEPRPVIREGLPLVDRVASRDNADRTAVETAYKEGDAALRRSLLEAAIANTDKASVDLLRLAVFGLDVELGRLAREALARTSNASAVDLIVEALRVPMDPSERETLIASLERLGESSQRARTMAVVFRGLEKSSSAVDVDGWTRSLQEAEGRAAEEEELTALASRLEGVEAGTRTRPLDATSQLELAEASLALAVDPQSSSLLASNFETASRYTQLLIEDAHRAGLRAAELGASGWRVDAVVAISAYYLERYDEAYQRAEAAVAELPAGTYDWNAMAVLSVFAEARRIAIARAVRDQREWPAQWLTDVHAAYSVLARHPLGDDSLVVGHYDFLKALGAAGRAGRVIQEGLARFPESSLLHDRLRARLLEEKGVDGLEVAYEAMLERVGVSANQGWFAGYTSIVAAEFHRRSADNEAALAAYDRAIAHYEGWIESNPEARASADHYVALALAGRARLALEAGEDERALTEILTSFERGPLSAATLDGLNLTAVATARMLLSRLREAGNEDAAARLSAAIEGLDPEMLRPAPYDRNTGRPPRGRNR